MTDGEMDLKKIFVVIAILFVAIIFSIANMNKTQNNIENSKTEEKTETTTETKKTYKDLESELKIAAEKYQNANYEGNPDNVETIILKYNFLKKSKYLEKITDIQDKKECTGYVKFIKNKAQITYVPYLKCSNYETQGFDSNNL
jgi:hypothetical protein